MPPSPSLRIRVATVTAALLLCLWTGGFPAVAAPPWQAAPLYGGEVRSIAFAPEDPQIVLAGTAAGQIFRSDDAGATWRAAGRAFPLPGWVVSVLHFDANEPGRLWAGLRGIFGGGAVVLSDDLGATWTVVARRTDDELFSLTTVAGRPGRLWIGTRTGVWTSGDHGATWSHASAGQAGIVEVFSLMALPGAPDSVVAGTFRRAYRTDDGGASWDGVFDGMVVDTHLFDLEADPDHRGDLWASTCGWVYHWSEAARKWTRWRDGLEERRAQTVRPLPGGRVLAGTIAGVYGSNDGGRRWTRLTDPNQSILVLAHHPRRPEVVLAGTEGSGILRSTDGGRSFQASSTGLAASRVSALAIDGDRLLLAVAHSGDASGLYAAIAPQQPPGRLQSSELGTVSALLVDRSQAWAATEKGLFARQDGRWWPVADAGRGSVRQVLAGERGGLVVLTDASLVSNADGAFRSLDGAWGRPLSVARVAGQLWISGSEGAAVQNGDGFTPADVPAAGAQLVALGEALGAAHPSGAWIREPGAPSWKEVSDTRSRWISTGDGEFPALLVRGEDVAVYDAGRRALEPLNLPFSGWNVLAAAVWKGELVLGTAGLGLVHARLDELGLRSQSVAAR